MSYRAHGSSAATFFSIMFIENFFGLAFDTKIENILLIGNINLDQTKQFSIKIIYMTYIYKIFTIAYNAAWNRS